MARASAYEVLTATFLTCGRRGRDWARRCCSRRSGWRCPPSSTGTCTSGYFPPLHAEWDPRVGWGTVPAVVLGALSVRYAGDLAARLSWGRLLLAAYAAGLAWMLSLALVDGLDGIGHILDTSYEYLDTARATTDLPATLDEYVSRIPVDAPGGQWPVHIAGHPPGALTFFVVLVRIGLGSGLAAGFVVTLLAASTAVAVLVTLRTLGAEQHARMAAPFLVIGPAAVWQCVSADAMFAAFAAWGMCALALGARTPLACRGRCSRACCSAAA